MGNVITYLYGLRWLYDYFYSRFSNNKSQPPVSLHNKLHAIFKTRQVIESSLIANSNLLNRLTVSYPLLPKNFTIYQHWHFIIEVLKLQGLVQYSVFSKDVIKLTHIDGQEINHAVLHDRLRSREQGQFYYPIMDKFSAIYSPYRAARAIKTLYMIRYFRKQAVMITTDRAIGWLPVEIIINICEYLWSTRQEACWIKSHGQYYDFADLIHQRSRVNLCKTLYNAMSDDFLCKYS